MKKNLLVSQIFALCLLPLTSSAQRWVYGAGSVSVQAICEVLNVAADRAGNAYAAGYIAQPAPPLSTMESSFGPYTIIDSGNVNGQMVVVSTDSAGRYRWAMGTEGGTVWPMSIETDLANNLYVFGYTECDSFNFGSKKFRAAFLGEEFCIKISNTGSVLWIKEVYGAEDWDHMFISDSGFFYFSRGVAGNLIVAKCDTGLTMLGTLEIVTFGSVPATIAGLTVAANGDIYICGKYTDSMSVAGITLVDSSSYPSFYVAKINSGLLPEWGQSVTCDTSSDNIYGITCDGNNNAYVCGTYAGNISFGSHALPYTGARPIPYTGTNQQLFICKYEASGSAVWAQTIKERGMANALAISADQCGNVWACGQGGYHHPATDAMFLAHFDTAGNFVDTLILPSGGDDWMELAVDFKGSVYLGSDYGISNIVIGADTLPAVDSTINEALFIARYEYNSSGCSPDIASAGNIQAEADDISVFPNPASGQCTVHSDNPFPQQSKIQLSDMEGRLLQEYPLSGNNTVIPLSSLPPGIYLCRVITGECTIITRKLVVMK